MKKLMLLATVMIGLSSFGQIQIARQSSDYTPKFDTPKVQAYADHDTLKIVKAKAIQFGGITITLDSLTKRLTKKADTVLYPIAVYEKTDTLSATFVYGASKMRRCNGYALIRGFKVQKGNTLEWVEQPSLAGVLDEKKRPVTDVLNGTVAIQQK